MVYAFNYDYEKWLISMRNKYLRKIFFLKKIIFTIAILSLMGLSLIGLISNFLTSNTSIPLSVAASENIRWNITLRITDFSGIGNAVILGEATDASNGQDQYDIAAPPMPPQFPSITAWFQTPFPVPFNQLIHEYKYYPSTHAAWNLSILWIPEPGNTTSTMIRIQWDLSGIIKSPYQSFVLLENNTVLANMLIDNSYVFSTNGSLHRFQIIGQREPAKNTTQTEALFLPLLIGIIIVVFFIIAIFFVIKRRMI